MSIPPAVGRTIPASEIFKNVSWSTSKACITQETALISAGIKVSFGSTYLDVDELEDLIVLQQELNSKAAFHSPRVRRFLLSNEKNLQQFLSREH
mmetsp:Transcript_6690/g.7676  ORF Transcript_6690/g.7676 Transcript_6690/m.7676 type:complete len:95 (-) Transcript_6690:827-1111(-)